MKRLAAALAIVLSGATAARAQNLAGDWLGTLLHSIDQGAKGIPVSSIAVKDTTLTVALTAINGAYEGRISADGDTIDGTWTQAGSLPLTFRRVKDPASLIPKRPQHPVPPYPYRQEDLTYANPSANVTLAATLTIPNGPGPFPAVLLITGSGPQDRDETLMGHRPFLVLADHLTRNGIAVLRADDRGFAKSTGSHATATTVDFASDAEAGVAYLMTRPEVNKQKIGLVGHSEGGIVASMVGARSTAVAFMVLLAGSGIPGDEIIVAQSSLIAEASGVPREMADANIRNLRSILDVVKGQGDDAAVNAKIQEVFGGQLPPAAAAQLKALTSPWFRYFITYDPAPTLRLVKQPVLAMNGEKDLQVPSKRNLDAIRGALTAGGNTRIDIVEMPGLNHLFQTATTGVPAEYAQIEETMAPAALEKISGWIRGQ